MEAFRGKLVDETTGPNVARLMASGFDPRFKIERLPAPIRTDEGLFVTRCELLAIPRAKGARKLDPAMGQVVANAPVEAFAVEVEHGTTHLRDAYAEKCASVILEMIEREAPGVLVAGA